MKNKPDKLTLMIQVKLAFKMLEKTFERFNGRKPTGKDIAYYAPYSEIYVSERQMGP